MSNSAALWRNARVMSLGTALSRATGLLRAAALAYALGVTGTRLADTYNIANTTPNIIYELFLGGILTSVFIPVLIETRERRNHDPSALISVSLVALAVVSALAAFAAPLVIKIYSFRIADPAVRAAQIELASFLLRWFAPQIFFYGLSAVAQALLNVRGRFGLPAFAPVLNNLVVTATFLAYGNLIGSQGLVLSTQAKVLLGAGTTAGVLIQALVLLPALRGEGLRFRPAFTDPAVKRATRLALYVIGYVVINQIGLWVVLALANSVRGGVTSWQLAFMFFQLPHGLFGVSIHTALFPELSRTAGASDWEGFRHSFATGIRGVAFLLLPAAVGYGVLAYPITRLLLVRGAAGPEDAAAVASVLQLMAVGLVFFSAFHLLTRCFYALQDTRTPAALNALAVALNIALAIPLFALLEVRGLAVAHAAAYAGGAVMLTFALARKIPGGLRLQRLTSPLARIGASSAAMGAAVWTLHRWTPGADLFVVGVAVVVGAILYVAFSQVAGVEERSIVLGFVRRGGRGGK